MSRFIKNVFLYCCLVSIPASCVDPADINLLTIWEELGQHEEYTEYRQLLEENGYQSLLSDPTAKYSLIVCSNCPSQHFDWILESGPCEANLQNLLKYFVVLEDLDEERLSLGGTVSTLYGELISISSGHLKGYISVPIRNTIQASNGTILFIDDPISPASWHYDFPLLLTQLNCSRDLQFFANAMLLADEWAKNEAILSHSEFLSTGNPITLFIPPDVIFNQLDITLETYSNQEWYNLIGNHIAAGIYRSGSSIDNFTEGLEIPTFSGNNLVVLAVDDPIHPDLSIFTGITLDSNNDGMTDGQIMLEDFLVASNGTVHILSGILY